MKNPFLFFFALALLGSPQLLDASQTMLDRPDDWNLNDPVFVSSDGAIVLAVALDVVANRHQVVRWVNGGNAEPFRPPDGVGFLRAMAASRDGKILYLFGVEKTSFTLNIYRWTEADGVEIIIPDVEDQPISMATSYDGSVIGLTLGGTDSPPQAVLWTEADGIMHLADVLGNPYLSVVTSMSDDATVIAGYAGSRQDTTVFYYREGEEVQWLPVKDPSGGEMFWGNFILSGDGSTLVGSASQADLEPEWFSRGGLFRWSEDRGFEPLNGLARPTTWAWGAAYSVSYDGSIVAGYLYDPVINATLRCRRPVFLWDEEGIIYNLNDLLDDMEDSLPNLWCPDSIDAIYGNGLQLAGLGGYLEESEDGTSRFTDSIQLLDLSSTLIAKGPHKQPEISAVGSCEDGYFLMQFSSVRGYGYQLLYSDDLKTWEILYEYIYGSGNCIELTDVGNYYPAVPSSLEVPRRFYKLRLVRVGIQEEELRWKVDHWRPCD